MISAADQLLFRSLNQQQQLKQPHTSEERSLQTHWCAPSGSSDSLAR